MLRFDIITIFPHMFDSYRKESILARAEKKRLLEITAHNLRGWTRDKHKMVDDKPFGGGAGMVLKIEPIYRAVQSLSVKRKAKSEKPKKRKVILLSAKGKQFTQEMARKLAKLDNIIFVCGRYEGVDERVATYIADEEISIGPYVLTGGELPAMVMIDAISRHIPGVLGNAESLKEESFSRRFVSRLPSGHLPKGQKLPLGPEFGVEKEIGDSAKRLEYPHYTRPEVFSPRKGVRWRVPKVLLSGDHKKIATWRHVHTKQK